MVYEVLTIDHRGYVNARNKTMALGDAAGDRLRNIEKLIASSGDDLIHAGSARHVVDGSAGTDTLSFVGSNAAVKVNLSHILQASWTASTITIDTANDGGKWVMASRASTNIWTLSLKAANTVETQDMVKLGVLNSGATALLAGHDSRISLSGTTLSVAASTLGGGYADGDSILNIENLTGSRFDDTLSGDAGANILDGKAGADTIDGGAGDDRIIGGAGADRIDGGAGSDTLTYAASAGWCGHQSWRYNR